MGIPFELRLLQQETACNKLRLVRDCTRVSPAILSIAILLTGCGGGGSGGDDGGGQPLPSNQPPAAAGCLTTPQSETITGVLQAIDNDNSASELLFSLGNVPNNLGPINTAKGTVQLLDPTTGRFEYTPNATGPRGVDTFQFQVSDPESSATGTETVIINPAIMPLGDSITAGIIGNNEPPSEERVGYRSPLYDDLTSAGFMIDLVGSQRGGQNASPPIGDPDHEGYGGATAADIAFGGVASEGKTVPPIFNALSANPADVVLLHIGTNDINNDVPENTARDIDLILNEIDRWEMSPGGNPVTVVLSTIIERSTPPPNSRICDGCNDNVTALNTLIQSIPAQRPNDDIVFVDQHGALDYSCSDGACDMNPQDVGGGRIAYIHPTPGGYADMADTWVPGLIASDKLASCE